MPSYLVCGLPSNTIATRAVCMRGYDDEAHIYRWFVLIRNGIALSKYIHFFSYVPRGYLCKMIFAQISYNNAKPNHTHFPIVRNII